jgi:hypothetical protein
VRRVSQVACVALWQHCYVLPRQRAEVAAALVRSRRLSSLQRRRTWEEADAYQGGMRTRAASVASLAQVRSTIAPPN